MRSFSRPILLPFAVVLVLCLFPTTAAAQGNRLRIATIAASAAAGADWASTYYGLKNYHVEETHPLLRRLDTPASVVTVGALIDTGSFAAWNLTMGRKNERLATSVLWATTAYTAYVTIQNIRTMRRALRRR